MSESDLLFEEFREWQNDDERLRMLARFVLESGSETEQRLRSWLYMELEAIRHPEQFETDAEELEFA